MAMPTLGLLVVKPERKTEKQGRDVENKNWGTVKELRKMKRNSDSDSKNKGLDNISNL